jgi:hypothetical protein
LGKYHCAVSESHSNGFSQWHSIGFRVPDSDPLRVSSTHVCVPDPHSGGEPCAGSDKLADVFVLDNKKSLLEDQAINVMKGIAGPSQIRKRKFKRELRG